MPELPEVEAAARALARAVRGRTIARVEVLHPALARRLAPAAARSLAGRRIVGVTRRGKHQLIALDDGRVLVAHFRLNGDWVIGRDGEPLPRFARAAIVCTDGRRVVLEDSRALCTLEVAARAEEALPALGPEPLSRGFTPAVLGAALARRRGPVKPALLDQRVVAGLGNIYAAEALWLARVSPFARASSLGAARLAVLVRAIKQVLRRAPPGRYWLADGERTWRVYDREGERCRRCGAAIRRRVQAGRSTFYCPACQRR